MEDVGRDQFAVLRVEGMHCHKCEASIQKALAGLPGVREVEVDFASGQASVLFDRDSVTVKDLMDAVNGAGYRATGFTQAPAVARHIDLLSRPQFAVNIARPAG